MTLLHANVVYPDLRPGAKPSSQPPREVRVLQAEWAHEAAVITYNYDAVLKEQCRRGVPVRVTYGVLPKRSVFVGVVHHITVDQRANNQSGAPRLMRIVCVGATDVLNTPGVAQYRDTRVDAVVSDLARKHGLSVLVERHPYSWPLQQQREESTWAFLVACARKVGWTLYAVGTDLRCHGRAIRFQGALTFRDYGAGSAYRLGAINAFDVVHAETLNSGPRKRERVVQGVDELGNTYTTATTQQDNLSGPRAIEAGLVEYRKTSARSIAEADAVVKGEQESNRHYIRARASISGDSDIHAGGSLRLTGIDRDYNGYWYVSRAEHVLTQNIYQIAVELGRDSLGDPTSTRRPIDNDLLRPVVNDGLRVGLTTNLQQESPPGEWSALTKRWRAQAAIERVLPPLMRPAPTPPPVVINV